MTESAATRVRAELVGGRTRFTELRAGTFLRPRPLSVDGPVARLALVGSYATLLAGDDLRIEVDVGPGVWLELVEPSGTVAYDAQGGEAHWSAQLRVAQGGRLVWRGAPFVVTAGANLRRDTRVSVEAGARVLLSETLVLGRTYEDGGGPLRSTMRVDHAGRPLLVEDLDLREAGHRERPGIMADNRAMTSVLLLGARPAEVHGRHESRFAGEGAMARALARHAHDAEAAVDGAWHRWRGEFADPGRHRVGPTPDDGPRPADGASAGSPHRSAAEAATLVRRFRHRSAAEPQPPAPPFG
ncbi:urease accessory protein UreD [Georgenia sunbinii]|uniref:urease accessory protein UreD n=1 Tax=Georgenia sunbinii TaxID=3117728 RepID=UPI002F265062